jgi:hypothetical protein
MLCEEGTTNFLRTRNEGLNGTTRDFSHQFSQDTASIHIQGRSSHSRGRLQQTTLPYQAMHQMNLPSNNHFAKLFVTAEHIRLHHAGPKLLIASLREKY